MLYTVFEAWVMGPMKKILDDWADILEVDKPVLLQFFYRASSAR